MSLWNSAGRSMRRQCWESIWAQELFNRRLISWSTAMWQMEATKMMKLQDPSIKTILCGSSHDQMSTYPDWDRTVLEIAWDHTDYLSMHYYAGNPDNDTASYLARAVHLERFVDTLEGTLRYVKAKRRSQHDIHLSWDEWQVWYKGDPMQGNWKEAPHLAE